MPKLLFLFSPADQKIETGKVHFPGLNGLRFFAALAVLIHHVEQIKMFQGLPNEWNVGFFAGLGDQGVNFFFTLSGFLITYLLYREHEATGIDLKKFYLRRILRIWPLYYTITILGFFVFPHIGFLRVENLKSALPQHFTECLAFYFFFSAHISERFIGPVIFASALWSTSVEEHFYIIWAPLLKILKGNFHYLLFVIIVIWASIREIAALDSFAGYPELNASFHLVNAYLHMFRIDCMAVGGTGAWLYLTRPNLIRFTFPLAVQISVLVLLAYRLVNDLRFSALSNEINCLLFLTIIFNVTMNPRSLLKLENPMLDFLGKVSFGIYAYNWVGITIWINAMLQSPFAPINETAMNLTVYSGSLAVVGILAVMSYFIIEKPFLNIKKRFSRSQPSMTGV